MSGRPWVRWAGPAAGLAILGVLVGTVADAGAVVAAFDWQPSVGWLALAVVLALVLSRQIPGGVAVALSVGSRRFLIATELAFVGMATLAGRGRGAR